MSSTHQPFPGSWVICSECDGDGTTSGHLGSFTSDEWADQTDDFKEDYLAGRYDVPCEHCRGSGKVRAVDVSRCTFAQKRALVVDRQNAQYAAESAAERRAEMRHCGYEC